MGQNYVLVFKKPKEDFEIYIPKVSDGYKLMEFSTGHNTTTSFVCNKLKEIQRFYVIGDYAKSTDLKNKDINLDLMPKAPFSPNIIQDIEYDFKEKWVFNLMKGLCFPIDSRDKIFKLFLLCSCGNGKASGDYFGVNTVDIGKWCGDPIQIRKRQEGDGKLFKECDVIFDEF